MDLQRLDVLRWCRDAEGAGDAGHVTHVGIALVGVESLVAVTIVGGEERVDLGDVHPAQQMWIGGGIGPSVIGHARDAIVDRPHDGTGPLGLGGRPEGGRRQEVGRPLQAAPRIGAVVAVPGDTGHGEGMQRLQQQGPQATDEHRGIGMDAPDRRLVVEPAFAGSVEQLLGALLGGVADHPLADLIGDPRAQSTDRVEAHVAHGPSLAGQTGSVTGPLFASLDDVVYGRAESVAPFISRVIAENPSKFTYRGTGTYLIGDAGGGPLVVIDPGPDLDPHREALALAIGDRPVTAILITHCHSDHSPLSRWLAAETGAETIGFGPHPRPTPEEFEDVREESADESRDVTDDGSTPDGSTPDGAVGEDTGAVIEESTDYEFDPDRRVTDGEVVVDLPSITIRAVHTPGHTSNHLCFAFEQQRALFTGDHIMGWSTTVVSAPDGDMAAYMRSLLKVVDRADTTIWPTHGPPRTDVVDYVGALYEHRQRREHQIVEALTDRPQRIAALVAELYADVRTELHKAAARSVHAHLVKLVAEGRVRVVDADRPQLSSTYVVAR